MSNKVHRPIWPARLAPIALALMFFVPAVLPGYPLIARAVLLTVGAAVSTFAVYLNRAALWFEGRDIVISGWRERCYDGSQVVRFRSAEGGRGYVIWLDFHNGGSLALPLLSVGLITSQAAQRRADALNRDLASARG